MGCRFSTHINYDALMLQSAKVGRRAKKAPEPPPTADGGLDVTEEQLSPTKPIAGDEVFI